MAVNVGGVVSIVLFYLLILFVGIGAAWFKNRKQKQNPEEEQMQEDEDAILAGRSIGFFVGSFTMTGMFTTSFHYFRIFCHILSCKT